MLPLTPTKLGRYEIADEIGKGAMGVVYLARDPLIGRLVALKTFRIGYSVRDSEMEQFRIRFMREAQSAGILTHPNIVTIHDVVEASDEGLAFIAMEYVRGTNLKLLLQNDQALPLSFVLETIAQVGDALDYAHSNRVVHRDVKPANILITTDNKVKITDFGIARLDSSNLTQEGQLLGTPNYMAPEQIQGKEVDHRADLFSLGVVLYEMLTRHKPFQGENLTVVSHRIVYDHFTPPREYMREMPPGIEPILDHALEKDPARRYQRAKEMVDDLRRVVGALAGEDLNETQSLSLIAPILTPPDHAGITDTGTGSGTGLSTGASLPEPPPLPAVAPPPLPKPASVPSAPPASAAPGKPSASPVAPAAQTPQTKPQAPRPSPLRLLAVGAIAAALALLLGTAPLLWLSWRTPARGRDAQKDATQSRVLSLLHTGDEQMSAGDPAAAAASYGEAERLSRGKPRLRRLRERAEQRAQQLGMLIGVEREKVAKLMEAQQAMTAHRYDDALAAANAALALDPANPQAQQILADARAAQERARRAAANANRPSRRGQETTAASQPTPADTPARTPARSSQGPAAPTAQGATLQISFVADTPALAFVYIGPNQIFRKSVGERGGLLHHAKGGQAEGNAPVTSGSVELRVYVTPSGQKAWNKNISGNFPGGGSRTLEIRVSAAGVPSAELH